MAMGLRGVQEMTLPMFSKTYPKARPRGAGGEAGNGGGGAILLYRRMLVCEYQPSYLGKSGFMEKPIVFHHL